MAVPATPPVTTPVTGSILAVTAGLTDHVPPAVESCKVVVLRPPAHTLVTPVIIEGCAFTSRLAVTLQPVGNVYITPVVPPFTPVATPDELMVAIIGVVTVVVQVPPAGELPSEVVDPWQTTSEPEISDGS